MNQDMNHYDCIVIGGGPGGSAVATLVADKGFRVLVVEREKFPRFHIGESLMPESYWEFERLGMLDKLRKSNFVRKHSVQFVTPSGKESAPFYFEDENPHECSVTWQVVRSEFDRMLLENAVEHGAEAWQEANVTEVLMSPGERDALPRATGVMVKRKGDAEARKLTARVVVDATGTNAMLAKRLGLRKMDPALKKASIFTHYKGGRRDSGRDEGATLVLATPDHNGWFWYIPLPDDVVSVGVCANLEKLVGPGQGSKEEALQREIEACPAIAARLENAQRVGPVHVLSDFSYRASRCAGEGWVLVGDAFGFLDPMYSSGVFLALKSGSLAADAIVEGLQKDDLSAEQLSKWGGPLAEGMQAIRKLVYAFYTPDFSFGKFIRQHPNFKRNITELLIGDVFRPEVNQVFEPMKEMVALPPASPLDDPKAAMPAQTGA